MSCSYLKDKIKKLISFVWHMRTTKPLDTYLGQTLKYEGWNFNSGNYLFANDKK